MLINCFKRLININFDWYFYIKFINLFEIIKLRKI